ncbi:hypothetical protein F4811DRAFT_343607 [Daldinia bambusicola]|nr:hypothetical protein F4811DRAFT_343607 [Daldinia bambusicola]
MCYAKPVKYQLGSADAHDANRRPLLKFLAANEGTSTSTRCLSYLSQTDTRGRSDIQSKYVLSTITSRRHNTAIKSKKPCCDLSRSSRCARRWDLPIVPFPSIIRIMPVSTRHTSFVSLGYPAVFLQQATYFGRYFLSISYLSFFYIANSCFPILLHPISPFPRKQAKSSSTSVI